MKTLKIRQWGTYTRDKSSYKFLMNHFKQLHPATSINCETPIRRVNLNNKKPPSVTNRSPVEVHLSNHTTQYKVLQLRQNSN
jgi:hypothetical protein